MIVETCRKSPRTPYGVKKKFTSFASLSRQLFIFTSIWFFFLFFLPFDNISFFRKLLDTFGPAYPLSPSAPRGPKGPCEVQKTLYERGSFSFMIFKSLFLSSGQKSEKILV